MSKKTNLSDYTPLDLNNVEEYKVGVITSEWNDDITFPLEQGCIDTLMTEGVTKDNLEKLRVPGTFELTVAAKMLLQQKPDIDAVICIGCVIKGETSHNEYINNAVANGLTQLSLVSGKPCIFGVLTPNDHQQALDRAGGNHGNKGVEAAVTALKMVALKKSLPKQSKQIGF